MIKIRINQDVKDAVDEHWKWIKRRFYIDVDYSSLNGSQKRAWTCAHKKLNKLYSLLGFMSLPSKDRENALHDLICVPPQDLKAFRDDGRFTQLVKKETAAYKAYQNWKRRKKRRVGGGKVPKCHQKEYDAEKDRNSVVSILGYEDLYEGDVDWDAYKLCDKIGLLVCPYCNRQYIYTIFDKNGCGEVRPQLDHFYVKSKYPYLSCSFYNLIPSCPVCNLGKNDESDETIYPYESEFGRNAVFRLDPVDLQNLRNGKIDLKKSYSVSIEFEYSDSEKLNKKLNVYPNLDIPDFENQVRNSDRIFHLTDLYNKHQIEIKELMSRQIKYAGACLGNFSSFIYGKKYNELSPTEQADLKQYVLGLPVLFRNEEYPLRKLKEDLVDQFENG